MRRRGTNERRASGTSRPGFSLAFFFILLNFKIEANFFLFFIFFIEQIIQYLPKIDPLLIAHLT